MPSQADILGFTNIWYASALRHPMPIQLENDLAINVIKPAYFLATKFIAFRSRGKSNYFGSHDFEDMILKNAVGIKLPPQRREDAKENQGFE